MPENKRHNILKPRRGIISIAPPFKAGDRDIKHIPTPSPLGEGVGVRASYTILII